MYCYLAMQVFQLLHISIQLMHFFSAGLWYKNQRDTEPRFCGRSLYKLLSYHEPDFPFHDASWLLIHHVVFFGSLQSRQVCAVGNSDHGSPHPSSLVNWCYSRSMRYASINIRWSFLPPLLYFEPIPKIFQTLHYFRLQLALENLSLQRCWPGFL